MTATQRERPIRVFAVGMHERMKNTLRFFFQGPCNNYCVLVEEDSAELGIIDLDGYQGRKDMETYRQRHPDQPLILLSLQDAEVEDAILLRKPLKPERLISALKQVKTKAQPPTGSSYGTAHDLQTDNRMQTAVAEMVKVRSQPVAGSSTATSVLLPEKRAHPQDKLPEPILSAIEQLLERIETEADSTPSPDRQSNRNSATAETQRSGTHQAAMYLDEQEAQGFIGSVPDIDLNSARQLANAQYDPDEFFQGYLRKAVSMADKHKRAVELRMLHGSFKVLPDTNCVIVDIAASRLRTICSMPVSDGTMTVSVMKKNPTVEDLERATTMGMEPLLWKAALWAARGRVPKGTSLTLPIFLRRWPNMTRLMLFPHAMRIAALWAEQPHSLLDTAKTLGIPQRYVFGFYSAANALELAAVSQREVDPLVEPTPVKKNRQRGLLGRILGRLRKNR